MAEQKTQEQKSEEAGYELRDANVRQLGLIALGLAVLIVAVLAAAGALLGVFSAGSPQGQAAIVATVPAPAQPNLIVKPGADMQALLAQENSVLSTYDWVDRQNNIVHIPITQAMQLIIKQNLPAQNAPAPTFGPGQAYEGESTGGESISPLATPEGTQANGTK